MYVASFDFSTGFRAYCTGVDGSNAAFDVSTAIHICTRLYSFWLRVASTYSRVMLLELLVALAPQSFDHSVFIDTTFLELVWCFSLRYNCMVKIAWCSANFAFNVDGCNQKVPLWCIRLDQFEDDVFPFQFWRKSSRRTFSRIQSVWMLHCHCTRFLWPLRDFEEDRFDVGLPHLRWAVRATVRGIRLKPFFEPNLSKQFLNRFWNKFVHVNLLGTQTFLGAEDRVLWNLTDFRFLSWGKLYATVFGHLHPMELVFLQLKGIWA